MIDAAATAEAKRILKNLRTRWYVQSHPKSAVMGAAMARTISAMKTTGFGHASSARKLLCASNAIIIPWIERQFLYGMDWSNHGDWVIDHIIPVSSARCENDFTNVCHYTNLRPLWRDENYAKFKYMPKLISEWPRRDR